MAEREFEIPEAMRDLAEQSVTQARSAYDQFIEASRKAQEMAEKSSGAMLASAKEVHRKALQFAEANMQAGFDLADKLVKVKDVREALELQNQFARKQMETYAQQARELTAMMTEAARKAQQR